MKKFTFFLVIFLIGFFHVPVQGYTFTDDFNRPDAATLGPNWTQQVGTMGIANNQAASFQPVTNYATVNGFSGAYENIVVSVDVIDVPHDIGYATYVALMFGILNDYQSIFVKVQDQLGNGNFNYYAFYYGNNGGGLYALLNQPFSSGRISAWASDADTVWLGIDSNFDGIFEQTYSNTGWSSKTLGTGVGLGMYGDVRADNFTVKSRVQQVPEPMGLIFMAASIFGLVGTKRILKK